MTVSGSQSLLMFRVPGSVSTLLLCRAVLRRLPAPTGPAAAAPPVSPAWPSVSNRHRFPVSVFRFAADQSGRRPAFPAAAAAAPVVPAFSRLPSFRLQRRRYLPPGLLPAAVSRQAIAAPPLYPFLFLLGLYSSFTLLLLFSFLLCRRPLPVPCFRPLLPWLLEFAFRNPAEIFSGAPEF